MHSVLPVPGEYITRYVADQAALIEALQQRRLRSAALDVFEQEPDMPFTMTSLDKLIMTPHIAAFAQETQAGISGLVCALSARIAGTALY